MSFWEQLRLMSAMTTILGVFLMIYGILNNKILRKEFSATREILDRMEQGQNEARKEAAEARKEMAETLRYLADLVRQEGEKTRQVIRASS